MLHRNTPMNRAVFTVLVLLVACGGGTSTTDAGDAAPTDAPPTDAAGDAGTDAGPRDWPAMDVPATDVVEIGVRRDVFNVPGTSPPPNPTTMDATPAALDVTVVVRYREDATPPTPARSIVVAYPGTFGGAATFEELARALVKRGTASGNVTEVWALDRRSNLLEDLRGMTTAQAAHDAEIAHGYYYAGETIGGTGFAGFRTQESVGFMSEWGLVTMIEDVRRVVALVPSASRRDHVFLMGHSAGAGVAESYAGWRFEDGTRGAEELAGVVLVDGASPGASISEAEYHAGFGSGFMTSPGVDAVRSTTRYEALPLLGVGVFVGAEILGMRALYAPSATRNDPQRNLFLSLLWSVTTSQIPTLTNRAAFGLAFDDESNGIVIFSASLGKPNGGETMMKTGLFGPLTYPSDRTATYDWTDAFAATPPEHTPVQNLAESWAAGRSNYADWYYPARLPLDQAAAGPNAITATSWQYAEGIRAMDGPQMDAPVLGVTAALVSVSDWDAVKARFAPAVGAGRPHAGASRDDVSGLGFRVVDAHALTHLDALSAADVAGNPVPAGVAQFLDEHAATGTVAVPAM